MRKDYLRKLSTSIGRLIHKSKKTNDLLVIFRETESFKQFQGAFKKAIVKQYKWAAKNIKDIEDVYNNFDTPAHQVEAQIGEWLNNHMPPLWDLVSAVRIYTYLNNAFVEAVKDQYRLQGIIVKGVDFKTVFSLTNKYYIAELKKQADYLIHRSKIDETTIQRITSVVMSSRLDQKTIDETANDLTENLPQLSDDRSFLIANTESNRAMSTGQLAFMKENNVPTKSWIPAGDHTCPICDANADDGEIGINETHSSGDLAPPAHPGCECYEESGKIDLDSVDLWSGD